MIIGLDESNFSPSLAGDCVVVAFANIGRGVEGVGDSKKLSPKKRLELFSELQSESLYFVVPATSNSISKVNVYLARNIAAASAVRGLCFILTIAGYGHPTEVLLDGYWSDEWLRALKGECFGIPFRGIIGGDSSVYEISAASIIAKVYCDCLFAGWESLFPNWGIGCDHGALSDKHLRELREKGPSPVHRTGVYGQDWWGKIFNYGLKRDKREGGLTLEMLDEAIEQVGKRDTRYARD